MESSWALILGSSFAARLTARANTQQPISWPAPGLAVLLTASSHPPAAAAPPRRVHNPLSPLTGGPVSLQAKLRAQIYIK